MMKSRFLCTVMLLAILSVASAQTTVGTVTGVNTANGSLVVAPDSLATLMGTNLAASTIPATTFPLPNILGTVQVTITDSTGAKSPAAALYMVSAGQINFVVPANVALGRATVSVVSSGNTIAQGPLLISNVAPSIITADMTGRGVPAAQVLRVTAGGVATYEVPFKTGTGTTFVTNPINLAASPTDQVFIVLYGTGIRRHSLNPVKASIGGVSVPVQYAGAQSQFPGLDQINLGPLPQSLVGKGEVDLILTVDGVPANTVRIAIQ